MATAPFGEVGDFCGERPVRNASRPVDSERYPVPRNSPLRSDRRQVSVNITQSRASSRAAASARAF